MSDENAKALRFKEGMGPFMRIPEDGDAGLDVKTEAYVGIYIGDGKIGYILGDGSVTYAARGCDLNYRPITLSREQRKRVDLAADVFMRKCGIEALVAACEEVMTLKQFPMTKDPPIESRVTFNEDGNGNVNLLKEGYRIGVMRTCGAEFGRLIMLYHAMHTGLTEADKEAITAKCREIVGSYKIE